MRQQFAATVPCVEVVDGTAEAMPFADGSLDAVTVAQAFHWFRFDEALAEIARASGRPVRFVPISADEYAARLSRAGLPDDVVWLLTYLFTEVLDGRNARLADGVQRALGRPPRDFGDYARRTASLWAA
jgi:hypothetical protein